MRHRPNKFLANATPEQVAEQEATLIKDVARLEKMNVIRLAHQLAREHPESEEMESVVNVLVELIALYKRNSILMQVQVKRLLRRLEGK